MNRKRPWGAAVAAALLGTLFVYAGPQARPERPATPEARDTAPQYERRNAIVEAVDRTHESIVTLKMQKRGNWGVKDVNGCGVLVDSRGYVDEGLRLWRTAAAAVRNSQRRGPDGNLSSLEQWALELQAIAVVAQRKTACPSWTMNEFRSAMKILSAISPSLPQTTGPMPGASSGSATGPTTAAPAPSAKMMQVERSVQSTHWDSFSAPITSTLRAVPPRTASLAVASA